MINIIIADDHAIVRKGLKQIIEDVDDLKVVDEVDNGNSLIENIKENRYDCIVMDLNMPGKSGLEALDELMEFDNTLNVLILSVHSEKQLIMSALRSGAKGYISKESFPDELVEAIKRVSNGEKYLSRKIAEKVVLNLADDDHTAPHELLSNREYETLVNIGSGKTVKEIADELNLSAKTVSTYRSRILEKMNMKSNLEIIHYVIKNGLIS